MLEDDFIQAIRAAPDDAPRRLVYADWLEENGHASKAEYLRLALQAAELHARLDELRNTFTPAWITAVREKSTQRPGLFQLRSGRAIYLRELRQWSVYEGLLEGLPTREMNRRTIEELVARERARASGAEPILIPPTEEPIEYRGDAPYPFGEPAKLPAIACVGRFTAFGPARDPTRDSSELVVIWFQEEHGLPDDTELWAQLRAIDWDRHAVDQDY